MIRTPTDSSHDDRRDACDLLGGKEVLAQRIVTRLSHRLEIQAALRAHNGDALTAVGSFTRSQILRFCYEDTIPLDELTGPIQWASEAERARWQLRAGFHVQVLDVVSLGDAAASAQFPGHPDLLGGIPPPLDLDS